MVDILLECDGCKDMLESKAEVYCEDCYNDLLKECDRLEGEIEGKDARIEELEKQLEAE